jgi:hypothetical protein
VRSMAVVRSAAGIHSLGRWALRSLGRGAEFVVIRGEGHLMNLTGRPSRRLTRARAVDRWFGRYLGLEDAHE